MSDEEMEELMKKTILVNNPDELRSMKQEMLNMCHKLDESCKVCYRKIDESKRVYDSPTGDYFREQASQFILKHQSYIADVVIPYINFLDKAISVYEDTYSRTKRSLERKVK